MDLAPPGHGVRPPQSLLSPAAVQWSISARPLFKTITSRSRTRVRNEMVSPLIAAKGTLAPWTSSVTFGGSDLRTVCIGSVLGATIPYFKAPVAGLPLTYAR